MSDASLTANPALRPLYDILVVTNLTGYRTFADGTQLKYMLARDPWVYDWYTLYRWCSEDYRFYEEVTCSTLTEALKHFRHYVTRPDLEQNEP